ncbi:uncharacterized protein LOC106702816 isoform X1 [Latimeria chalumnae]|uniref:uncharacterized protein LOC106702816 isoform X1 n=1 Tax=Latimeria chalumnae TaxID=7897 RepID=UPI0006D90366|nr:PREDICTED: uncharacterized protein LOC106702816 isoform X1 [Latimeria chalumnae]|eukprot:XP_014341662.1 PREDICTED: uncharacterized protein LOC106702816 isoform X1 [Latimeria chalumnae]
MARMSLTEGLKTEETMSVMKDLESRLRGQIDKLEHLRLSVSEAVSSSCDSSFSLLQQSNGDLKLSITDHMDWLSRLNERMETLQMNTTVFLQMNTKLRIWNPKHSTGRYSRWARPGYTDDARSEAGWSPVRTRRNSDAASEMSCAW